ncbi:hypothetical protein [Petrotoga sp. 9PWA.NaAc.5.4]|uniref:hypothetical protein n=1 Tax=Petrotoga sp. 9PWA.NaAc.5.4 TaxID=1434328 RepID=UPI000CBDA28E|nr:hypothetical protein [Petrotoga sp. 9PWA.NaAc.5.4]PNR96630.1 hypothetical protein X924_01650 [Petrotoga sp. 9PWA.NaAc.5.4]
MEDKKKLKEELIKKKKLLEAEKISIEKYMGPYEHDESLENEWGRINKELEEIESKLNEIENELET